MRLTRRKRAEMSEPQYEGGGWNNSQLDNMSPSTRARVLQADAEYAKQAAIEERERKHRAEELREQAFRASVQAALERGELVDMKQAMRDGGVGRTPAEVIAYASRMMDIEDARLAAEQRKAFPEFQGQYYADTSAPTQVELEAGAARAERDRRNEESARSRGEGYNLPESTPALRPVAHVSASPTYGSPLVGGLDYGGSVGLLAALEGVQAPSPAYRFVGASAARTLLLGRIKAALGALLGRFGDS
jgi:hypothetical protein